MKKLLKGILPLMALVLAGSALAGTTISAITPRYQAVPVTADATITLRGANFDAVLANNVIDIDGSAVGITNVSVNGAATKLVFTISMARLNAEPRGDKVVTVTTGTGAPTTTLTIVNTRLQVVANARIDSVIDVHWGAATTADGDANARANTILDYAWYVGGTDNTARVSVASAYDLSDNHTVTIHNASPAATGSAAVRILARTSATTTPTAPATTGWAVDAALPTGADQYAVTAKLGAAATTAPLTSAADTNTVQVIANGTQETLELTYYTPLTAIGTSVDGFQAATIRLTAIRN